MTTTATAATTNQELQLDITPPLQGGSKSFDDDGRLKRTGTVWTATAHIITAVIGSGVLSLAWAIAQLGWIGASTNLGGSKVKLCGLIQYINLFGVGIGYTIAASICMM
ncbi:hypothetical protein MKW92_028293 [Papaver armeniacum]|nr:hypothetical protein MKW92_028293 [Papaver armeniacum]